MITIRVGANEPDDESMKVKKAALARRLQGMKKSKEDDDKEELKPSSFGGK